MATRSDIMRQNRLKHLEALKDKDINPFPADVKRTHTNQQALKKDGFKVTVVGRLMAWRGHGKLKFADLVDESAKIQLAFKADKFSKDEFKLLKLFDIGDFLEVTGTTFTTDAGERTVEVNEFKLLSKALEPMPHHWQGLDDKEERLRKRYLDLLLNPEVKETLDKRWLATQAIREFLWREDYFEVETPVLQNLYGGTNARPFTTHLNALDIDMYLRVAPELYLKRLMVGGYERVFEIARNFRNEGMDQTHQPEFTMLEFYEAYADYHRIMDLTEELFKYAAQKVNGTLELKVEDTTVDLAGKWRRITIDEALEEYLDIEWETITNSQIKQILDEHHFQVPGVYTKEKALFTIYDHLVAPQLIEPTWVIDYPRDVSPLSKAHRTKEGRVERFEGYIGGKEICDGWSEIVSPLEQRERFETEQQNLKAGDDEAQPLDEDFLTALSYGSPPMGGIGIGIDRLVMFLTNTWSIREVVAFPLMKPENPTLHAAATPASKDRFTIAPQVSTKFPGMFYAVTTIKGVNITRKSKELEALKEHTIAEYTPQLKDIKNIDTIKAYRTLFKETGVWGEGRRPSPEALYRRLAKDQGIYQINTAVDAYNLAVIETGVGLGGFNAAQIFPPVTLRFTQKGENMRLLGKDKPVHTAANELAYADSEKLITLDLNWRDIDQTKITLDTTDIMLFADGAPGLERDKVVNALKTGADYITRFCGGEVGEILLVE